jgi:GntP family gluconate:H+ symporter
MFTTDAFVLLVFALGIVAIVVLTARYRWHAFVTIYFTTIAVGLASGLKPEELITYMVDGFGELLGYIAIVVVSGMIIGEFLDKTGAALTIARTVLRVVGRARTELAMGISGYILAIPVMCSDTAFIILSPIVRGLATGANLSLSFLSLALAVGAYTSFKLIPPSPGPLAILTMFKANFTTTLALAFFVSLPVFVVGYLWSRWCTARPLARADIASKGVSYSHQGSPGVAESFLPLAVPVLLIVIKAVADTALAEGHTVRAVIGLVGHPVIALPLGVGLLMLLNRRSGMETMAQWTSDAIVRSAPILLIVGAGGALGSVLQHTGVGEYLGELMTGAGIPGLLVPFLLAMTLKITQGSSLVTMFTTPAIVAPVLPNLGISPEIAALATCAGALAVVHVNDSFFWVVTRFAEMDVSEGYRSLTVLTLLQGLVALATVWGLSLVF